MQVHLVQLNVKLKSNEILLTKRASSYRCFLAFDFYVGGSSQLIASLIRVNIEFLVRLPSVNDQVTRCCTKLTGWWPWKPWNLSAACGCSSPLLDGCKISNGSVEVTEDPIGKSIPGP